MNEHIEWNPFAARWQVILEGVTVSFHHLIDAVKLCREVGLFPIPIIITKP